MLESAAKASASMLGTASNYRQSQTFTIVCLDHGAMINESCTPIPHSMRSDVDLHAASPVAQNKQGRVQDLGRGFCPISIIQSPQTSNFAASKQLSILQCNINGLCSTATKIKLEEIMEIAEKQKIQIIALQETKLNEKYNLKYKNYNILRKDRNKEGGGLAFLIKNLYYEDIAINIPNTSDLEAQGIKVYLNQNKTINIFNMYHPPNNKLIDDGTMAQFLTDNTIIVGDLNAKHQLWGCSTPNPRGKILSNLFDDNAFMCLNDGNPTHHSYSYNTAQALDISFSSPDIFHKCKWQILKSIGSDHLPILIEISTKTKTSSIKEKFWNFKKANWNLYQQNTNEDFRKAPTRIKDLEQNWISFKNTIIKAAKVSIPRGNIKKWIPNYTHQAKDIQTLITKRNELQKKCTQNQTNCRTELNIVNAKIKRLYVNMKREKWKQTCENLNPRNPNTKLWHLAKQIDRAQPQTENTNMIKNTDGTPATNDKNAANLLGNSYQISSKIKFEIKDKKVEKKARKIIHDCKNVTSTHNIFHEKINMKELDYALENTDLNKTPGPDGIHGQMISNLGKNGKEKLLDIFNNSWKTGKLPQDWKTATIIPIKKLDKSADDPKNYRPISLTSIEENISHKTNIGLFADDIILWSSNTNWKKAERDLNKTLFHLEKFANKHKLEFNPQKSETCLFTTDKKLYKIRPKIILKEQQLQYNKHPKYLGYTLDPEINSSKHIEEVIRKGRDRLKILKYISGREWGADATTLKLTYTSLIRPILEYGYQIYGTASETNLKSLERIQLSAARIITGLRNTCPNDIVLYEADIMPLKDRRSYNLPKYMNKIKSYGNKHRTSNYILNWESNLRLKKEGPLHLAKRNGFLKYKVEKNYLAEKISPCEPLQNVIFNDTLNEPTNKQYQNPEYLKQLSLEIINNIPKNAITIYTDGSRDELGHTGSGCLIKTTNGIEKMNRRNPDFCSVFRSELIAIYEALKSIRNTNYQDIWILTDSRSAIQHLSHTGELGDKVSRNIIGYLQKLSKTSKIHLQWIPSHVGIEGNEAADVLAKKGTKEPLPQKNKLTFKEIETIAKTKINKNWRIPPKHSWYSGVNPGGALKIRNRQHQTTLTRFRTGHLKPLKIENNNKIYPTCPKCSLSPTPEYRYSQECYTSLDRCCSSATDARDWDQSPIVQQVALADKAIQLVRRINIKLQDGLPSPTSISQFLNLSNGAINHILKIIFLTQDLVPSHTPEQHCLLQTTLKGLRTVACIFQNGLAVTLSQQMQDITQAIVVSIQKICCCRDPAVHSALQKIKEHTNLISILFGTGLSIILTQQEKAIAECVRLSLNKLFAMSSYQPLSRLHEELANDCIQAMKMIFSYFQQVLTTALLTLQSTLSQQTKDLLTEVSATTLCPERTEEIKAEAEAIVKNVEKFQHIFEEGFPLAISHQQQALIESSILSHTKMFAISQETSEEMREHQQALAGSTRRNILTISQLLHQSTSSSQVQQQHQNLVNQALESIAKIAQSEQVLAPFQSQGQQQRVSDAAMGSIKLLSSVNQGPPRPLPQEKERELEASTIESIDKIVCLLKKIELRREPETHPQDLACSAIESIKKLSHMFQRGMEIQMCLNHRESATALFAGMPPPQEVECSQPPCHFEELQCLAESVVQNIQKISYLFQKCMPSSGQLRKQRELTESAILSLSKLFSSIQQPSRLRTCTTDDLTNSAIESIQKISSMFPVSKEGSSERRCVQISVPSTAEEVLVVSEISQPPSIPEEVEEEEEEKEISVQEEELEEKEEGDQKGPCKRKKKGSITYGSVCSDEERPPKKPCYMSPASTAFSMGKDQPLSPDIPVALNMVSSVRSKLHKTRRKLVWYLLCIDTKGIYIYMHYTPLDDIRMIPFEAHNLYNLRKTPAVVSRKARPPCKVSATSQREFPLSLSKKDVSHQQGERAIIGKGVQPKKSLQKAAADRAERQRAHAECRRKQAAELAAEAVALTPATSARAPPFTCTCNELRPGQLKELNEQTFKYMKKLY
ncbi:hypothetical protein LAZ67_19000259, partial [Cordylochernes scorpioides]